MTRPPARFWFACACVVGVLAVTMTPSSARDQPFQMCLICGDTGVADVIANVILFIPFGVAVAALPLRWWKVMAVAALFSTAIELTQAFVIPGRDGALGDILFNTAGATIGAFVFACRDVWLGPSARRRVGLVAAAFSVAIVLTTGVLARPSLPSTKWFGQWTPEFGGEDFYSGHVLEARVGDRTTPSRSLDDSGATRNALVGGAPVIVKAIAGHMPSGHSTIFSIADDHHQFMLGLGASRGDLTVYVRRRSAALGLIDPPMRIPNALDGVHPGDTIVLEARVTDREVCAGRRPNVRCSLGLTAGSGWQMLVSMRSTRSHPELFDVLWLCIVLIPVGFWLNGWMPLIAVVVVCGIAPMAGGLVRTPAIEWLGALSGIAIGRLLALYLTRRASISSRI